MCLFFPWIIFLYSYFGTLYITSFFSSPSRFASRSIFSSSWLRSKYSVWMLPNSGYVQNCWVVMCYQLIFLMPPGIIPALTIYKVPTATPHVEMQLHFAACQNNRPFWDHCSFFGLWENTIFRSIVTRQVQAGSRCFSPNDFIIGRVCLGTECSTELISKQIHIFIWRPFTPFHLPMFKVDQLLTRELNISFRGFPGGSVVKNQLANTGDTGWIHDPGRSHMPQSN